MEQKKRLLKWLKRVMRGTSESTERPLIQSDTECTEKAEHGDLPCQAEEYEDLEDWREVRPKRKRRSAGSTADASDTGGEDSKKSPRVRPKPKLVVVELGCGDSLHSLRIEAELMVRENPSGT